MNQGNVQRGPVHRDQGSVGRPEEQLGARVQLGGRTVGKQGGEDPREGGYCLRIPITAPTAVATRKRRWPPPQVQTDGALRKATGNEGVYHLHRGVSPACPKWLERAKEGHWLSVFIIMRGAKGRGQGLVSLEVCTSAGGGRAGLSLGLHRWGVEGAEPCSP